MADKGWIKTYRKIQDCWIWLEKEPFDKRSAWIDLLLTANHADKKILFNGDLITVNRGQILTSIRKLADKWKWSYDKVLRFLKLIESDGMIKKESDNFRTLLTIENYEVYQDLSITDRTPTGERTSEQSSEQSSERTSDKQECKELKNVKNDKEDNINRAKSYSVFKPPTVDEVAEYCFERNNGIDANTFVDFYSSKGWIVGKTKMKDWKAAVRTWERKNNLNSRQPSSKKINWDDV